ncbi:MAG TPA: cupredoxin domain-containing protein [Acidimicrobiia bacterium]
MSRKTLLIAGLVALAASLIGPAVQATISGDTVGWGHMSGYGHMGWWGDRQTTGDGIEGASKQAVTATEFAFSPDELSATVGEPVNLRLVNAGDLPHDLVIPDLDIRLAAGPGQQATIGIEVDEAGSYQFVCSLPGHADAGMTGLLTVNPGT